MISLSDSRPSASTLLPARVLKPFVAIEHEFLDQVRNLPIAVQMFLTYCKKYVWKRGFTFFHLAVPARYFKRTVRTIRRWIAIAIDAGVLRRVKRTGRYDCFGFIEKSACMPAPTVDETQKMSGRFIRTEKSEINSKTAQPARWARRARQVATNFTKMWAKVPQIDPRPDSPPTVSAADADPHLKAILAELYGG